MDRKIEAERRRIAAVYVDVSAHGTDRAFDYLIPEALLSEVKVGSRVQVPFGPRKLMGYVAGFPTITNAKRLKSIHHVLDLTPPLTPELVGLAEWSAQTWLCPVISVLHGMVPAVLKGRYQRIISLPIGEQGGISELADEGEQKLLTCLQERKEVTEEYALALPGVTRSLLRTLVEEGRLQSDIRVGDQITRKTRTWVLPGVGDASLQEAMEELPPQASRQKEVLAFMQARPEGIPLPELLTHLGVSRSAVNRLIEKGLLLREEREEYRDPYAHRSFKQTTPLPLTEEQQRAFDAIKTPMVEKRNHSILLHGVTGSGKTEIYLQAITETLNMGRQAIVLVPEISLTPQMVERFKGRFGDRVAVLHSGLSKGERFDEWRRIRSGGVEVAIGARSAIFAPFVNIGLIIMDEEHESSYKQEETPRYHAREVAKKRCQIHDAVLVMGTATPSVETYYRARTGEYEWITLSERVHGRPFPRMDIVDMREELRSGNRSIFSKSLRSALNECVDRGGQAVLFLNRRGHSTFILCRECGKTVDCPHCDISLTYHRTNGTLRCHYCGHNERVPESCPVCGSSHIRYFGTGTQRVEEELTRLLPGMRTIRMDVDTVSRKGAHERLLQAFGEGKADVLLGTQMIAKGLDFPRVTLVGVIAADSMLHLPDYRAAERTFQLLTQVGGRAGRHEAPGRVVVQTYTPEHYSIRMAAQYEGEPFYRQECLLRKQHGYPPFCEVFQIRMSHPDLASLMQLAHRVVGDLRPLLPEKANLLGPVPAPIPRIKDRYRVQIMIKITGHIDGKSRWIEALRKIRTEYEDINLRVGVDREGF
ncbi:replication restart DNA helicase PriA [Marininema mesophilum]|uniref:Replication restart protein PriA n=1 Tax=Marininema mesophilum TaxID=1048340 RepID=A0A1H2Q690_9BACL|nr:primosomal protein N' [Marininema mesophilum]SDW02278.1 replication restart DNA helicase PriA [Marininema mesophilum]